MLCVPWTWGMASGSQFSRDMSTRVFSLREKQLLSWVTVGHLNYLVSSKALHLCVDMADLLGLSPVAKRGTYWKQRLRQGFCLMHVMQSYSATLSQDTHVFPFQPFASVDTKNMVWLIWNRTLMGLNTSLCVWTSWLPELRSSEWAVELPNPSSLT